MWWASCPGSLFHRKGPEMKFYQKVAASAAVANLALAMEGASAAAMTLPSELTDALASVAVIGAGVFAIMVGVKLFKWVRGAL